MAIYRMVGNKEDLAQVPVTSFGQTGVLERQDLQRILRDKPEILEDGLFILSEEFSNWQGSGRSIDLLALDQTGRLVVVELKRGETGEHMDLQAIRYAAMVSTITLQQAIDAHREYLNKRGIDEDAEERVNGHLENLDDAQEFSTDQPRIVLVSEGFSPELTTCVLWLNRNGLDVTCIRMQPYRNESELLVETSQVIPLPEAADYLVQIRERENEIQKQRTAPSKRVPGGEVFEEHIQDAQQEFHQELKRLYAWAVGLKDQELAVLESNHGRTCTTLGIILPGKEKRMLTVWNHWRRGPDISFDRNVFQELAPNTASLAKRQVDDLEESGAAQQTERGNVTLRSPVTDATLSILRDVYREANGRVGDDGGDGE